MKATGTVALDQQMKSLRWKGFVAQNAILFIWFLFFVVSLLFLDGFATPYNLRSYLANCSPLLVVACGLTVVTLNGGIDFSTTSVISLVSTISAYIMVKSAVADTAFAIPAAILAGFAIGAVVGAINGIAVSRLKMPSFVATLASMQIFSGLAIWFGSIFYEKISLGGLPRSFIVLGGKGNNYWVPVLVAAVVFLLFHWMLTRTLLGRHIYAVGVNPNTARISGVSIRKVIFIECLLCGLTASLAGLMYTAKNGAGITTMGQDMFIDIVGAVVIGGTRPAGGSGSVRQTLYGVLFLVLLNNILNLIGVPFTLYNVVKGIFILLAASLELMTRRMNIRAAARAARA